MLWHTCSTAVSKHPSHRNNWRNRQNAQLCWDFPALIQPDLHPPLSLSFPAHLTLKLMGSHSALFWWNQKGIRSKFPYKASSWTGSSLQLNICWVSCPSRGFRLKQDGLRKTPTPPTCSPPHTHHHPLPPLPKSFPSFKCTHSERKQRSKCRWYRIQFPDLQDVHSHISLSNTCVNIPMQKSRRLGLLLPIGSPSQSDMATEVRDSVFPGQLGVSSWLLLLYLCLLQCVVQLFAFYFYLLDCFTLRLSIALSAFTLSLWLPIWLVALRYASQTSDTARLDTKFVTTALTWDTVSLRYDRPLSYDVTGFLLKAHVIIKIKKDKSFVSLCLRQNRQAKHFPKKLLMK